MKTIHIQYYALLRDQRGQQQETIETDSSTIALLYEELKARHNFSLKAGLLMAAKNDEMCSWDTPIADGDKIVFIPPVAGG